MTQDDTTVDSMEVCGLEGDENGSPTRNEINRFIRRALFYHVKPLKKDMSDMKLSVDGMVTDYTAIKNQIKGAKLILSIIAGAIVILIPLALKILDAVNTLAK